MQAVIFGASGLLGRSVVRAFGDMTVTGTGFSRTAGGLVRVDATSADDIEDLLGRVRPDAVVNCVGERRPEVWAGTPAQARDRNVDAARLIAEGASRCGARLLHISSDYVFDGKAAPYRPDSLPNPLNAAMARRKQLDPTMALLETAIKATAKGGIGKLRQRSRGQVPYYEEYPALSRETWRPDIRAAVLANQRVGLHRKLMKTAAAADLYPTSIGTDAIVSPSPGPSPLDVLPHTPEGKPAPGTFRLGVSPGMVKHQGTQTVLWAEQQFEERGGVFNISNLIKTDQSAGEGE